MKPSNQESFSNTQTVRSVQTMYQKKKKIIAPYERLGSSKLIVHVCLLQDNNGLLQYSCLPQDAC